MITIEPIALTGDAAVFPRADYEAVLDAHEDAADARALAELRAREAAGKAEDVAIELAERIAAGENPLRYEISQVTNMKQHQQPQKQLTRRLAGNKGWVQRRVEKLREEGRSIDDIAKQFSPWISHIGELTAPRPR
jgi:predicted transcriptional regulator